MAAAGSSCQVCLIVVVLRFHSDKKVCLIEFNCVARVVRILSVAIVIIILAAVVIIVTFIPTNSVFVISTFSDNKQNLCSEAGTNSTGLSSGTPSPQVSFICLDLFFASNSTGRFNVISYNQHLQL